MAELIQFPGPRWGMSVIEHPEVKAERERRTRAMRAIVERWALEDFFKGHGFMRVHWDDEEGGD